VLIQERLFLDERDQPSTIRYWQNPRTTRYWLNADRQKLDPEIPDLWMDTNWTWAI
jgi:hypothetical protein